MSNEFRAIQEEMMTMSKEAEDLQTNHNAAKMEKESKKKELQATLRERSAATNELHSIKEDKRQVEDRLRELRNRYCMKCL